MILELLLTCISLACVLFFWNQTRGVEKQLKEFDVRIDFVKSLEAEWWSDRTDRVEVLESEIRDLKKPCYISRLPNCLMDEFHRVKGQHSILKNKILLLESFIPGERLANAKSKMRKIKKSESAADRLAFQEGVEL